MGTALEAHVAGGLDAVVPDIAHPPAEVLARADALDAALGPRPAKAPGRNIIIGTWNLRAFGAVTKDWQSGTGSPKRNFADLVYISRIIRRCDVVAVQEVRGNLGGLRHLMDLLGDDWAFILTDVNRQSGGNDERLAFLFDTTRVQVSGLACELVGWLGEQTGHRVDDRTLHTAFARTPYAVSFRSAGQTFILVTLHVNYGTSKDDRVPELRAIAEWLASWAEREYGWDHNVIALGDFNVDHRGDALFDALVSTGLRPATPLEGLPRTIFDQTAKPHYYDQVAWFPAGAAQRPALTLECVGGGEFDFVGTLRGDLTLTSLSWHISDHFPLWVEFGVP